MKKGETLLQYLKRTSKRGGKRVKILEPIYEKIKHSKSEEEFNYEQRRNKILNFLYENYNRLNPESPIVF